MTDQTAYKDGSIDGEEFALIYGLAGVSIEKAAQWYCELNSFRWPDDFPLKKPENHDGMNYHDKCQDKTQRIAFAIVAAFVPTKEKLRAWHKGGYCGDQKTDEEFDAWWEQKGCAYFKQDSDTDFANA